MAAIKAPALILPISDRDNLSGIKTGREIKSVTSLIRDHSLPGFRVLKVAVEVGMPIGPYIDIAARPADLVGEVGAKGRKDRTPHMYRIDRLFVDAWAVMSENGDLSIR